MEIIKDKGVASPYLSFGEAIEIVKSGKYKISQLGWEEDYLQMGNSYIGKSTNGDFQYWVPSRDDMLNNNWFII